MRISLTALTYRDLKNNPRGRNVAELAAILHTTLPSQYLGYLDPGRFRDALILDEYKRNPTEQLKKFIAALLPKREPSE